MKEIIAGKEEADRGPDLKKWRDAGERVEEGERRALIKPDWWKKIEQGQANWEKEWKNLIFWISLCGL